MLFVLVFFLISPPSPLTFYMLTSLSFFFAFFFLVLKFLVVNSSIIKERKHITVCYHWGITAPPLLLFCGGGGGRGVCVCVCVRVHAQLCPFATPWTVVL